MFKTAIYRDSRTVTEPPRHRSTSIGARHFIRRSGKIRGTGPTMNIMILLLYFYNKFDSLKWAQVVNLITELV